MTIEEINRACKDTFMELLGIEFTKATETSQRNTIRKGHPVDER